MPETAAARPAPPLRLVNVHVHTFTDDHVPRWFPHPLMLPFRWWPGLGEAVGRLLRAVGQERTGDRVLRLSRFGRAGQAGSQARVLRDVLPHYPPRTRFVVLPVDMGPMGYGAPRKDLAAQHDELARLARDPELGPLVIPFATIHPGRPDGVAELHRMLAETRADGTPLFRGVKLYPRTGFDPGDPVLRAHVYPLLAARGLPVISHCSRGGVRARHLPLARADRVSAPDAFLPVLEAFPGLKVCLAHFGGDRDWADYVEHGIDPADPQARTRNWQVRIRDLIGSGHWPGLWTDISYTLFRFDDYIPFLRLFLTEDSPEAERLRSRVLFGSDFYMTRQEALSERAVCFRLRNALGEEIFRRIGEENPMAFLGEIDPRPVS